MPSKRFSTTPRQTNTSGTNIPLRNQDFYTSDTSKSDETKNTSHHKVRLKPVSLSLPSNSFIKKSQKNSSKKKNKKNTGLYQLNNQKLQFLPQLAVGIVVLTSIGWLTWLYWPADTTEATSDKPLIAQQALTPSTIAPVVIPSENNSAPAQNTLSPTTFEIKSKTNQSCTLTSNTAVPNSIAQTPFAITLSQTMNISSTWWEVSDPQNCSTPLTAVFVGRLSQDQAQLFGGQLDRTTTSIQLIDGRDTYAVFFGDSNYDGASYLKLLTQNLTTDVVYFDATRAYAQKRIGNLTYYLDGGCQAPRTGPCTLWQMDIFSGQVTLLKKDIALTGAGQAYEIKEGRLLRFATRQDYDDGINFIFVDKNSGQATLIRVSIKSDSLPITSDYDLTPGEEAYIRYV